MTLNHQKLLVDGEVIDCRYRIKETNAIILHGAGASESSRYDAMADELLRNNVGVVLFDFSGHGKSSGTVQELSLARRVKQARTIIELLVPPESSLYLIGFSMSGQTVCDLLPLFGNRTKAVLLGCPAAYREDVRDISFGNEAFKTKIREHESWKESTIHTLLQHFDGRTIIAIGDQDDIIPKGVISMIRNAAKDSDYVEYAQVTHQLANWLGQHPAELQKLIKLLLAQP